MDGYIIELLGKTLSGSDLITLVQMATSRINWYYEKNPSVCYATSPDSSSIKIEDTHFELKFGPRKRINGSVFITNPAIELKNKYSILELSPHPSFPRKPSKEELEKFLKELYAVIRNT